MREVYGAQRGVVQRIINDSLEQASQKFVQIDDVVLRQVELPEQVRGERRRQDGAARASPSRTPTGSRWRRKEAERRQIEATGLKHVNDTLNCRSPRPCWRGRVWKSPASSRSPATRRPS